jgi:CRISPR-associated protein Csc3
VGSEPDDGEENIWTRYLKMYLLIDGQPVHNADWDVHLTHYVKNQHGQCVHCSGPFPLTKWRKSDVRGELLVQSFSNRLSSGGGEPTKNICQVCRMQFLLEALNYPPRKGETLFYLHLSPRTFRPPVWMEGLVNAFRNYQNSDVPVQALNLDQRAAFARYELEHMVRPSVATITHKGEAHSYGPYVPKFPDSIAGTLIWPVNAPGENETDKYLFVLWNALVWGRFLGMKIIISQDPVPPLEGPHLPDLALDMVPLGCTGLLKTTAYNMGDGLDVLWRQAVDLFALKRLVFPAEDHIPALVRAMGNGALYLFFEVDRLLEGQDRLPGKEAVQRVDSLVKSTGDSWMAQLSEVLNRLAAHARQYNLRGRSFERSSILFPVAEVFAKLETAGAERDQEFLMAATVQDIFAHLERLAVAQYKPGATKYGAVVEFVRLWYEEVLDDVYRKNWQRLLRDEKLIRSAYLFYFQMARTNRPDTEEETPQ